MHRCQICGDVLFHDDFFSDPSQHVCLTVNGPGMIDPHANGADIVRLTKQVDKQRITNKHSTVDQKRPAHDLIDLHFTKNVEETRCLETSRLGASQRD